ncbi:uncharacterized protein BX663DRAFT_496977 [Cokeromyces recurvatus]|uniref:uncharacterized protein n=1 Tax=Cokeromyces recurvatus TaxID=90255 RepID=UPI00222014A1|nr:uncharacterized protein BX663DRAFT_496977 [Cokeromyces recurvatus]KAI7906573.1 hypothetical protein BX663DRAFT_496977 [Cokeromyces recurvatus]
MEENSNMKQTDDIIEEFDEKVKVISQLDDEDEQEFKNNQKQEQFNSIKVNDVKEMEHIFNQFIDENNNNYHSEMMRRPSFANELKIDTPLQQQQEIPFDFNRFLDQMKNKSSKPITRYFKSFLQAFDRRAWTVNEQIKIIQDFLDFIYVKMRECDVWKDMSEQEFGNAKEGMEKLVMNRLYHVTFCPNTTDDKERDEILQQKINIFRWVREKHLDIPETEYNESFLTFAESEILKMNNYKSPRDKLICILNCCKVIFGLIKHVEGDAGADKFLPILIYVVIRANPPKLVSNVQYIYRFRNPEQLQAEAGYYLTNLMGAISFIETMEAKSLSISEEEFDKNIERTMLELKKERPPSMIQDKQQISYENTLHPSSTTNKGYHQQQPLLIDSAKAAALLERGSQFAQKTMQRPLSFVGKIFQGLSENRIGESSSSSDEEDRHYHPPLPPRPPHQRQFEDNLETLNHMFSNVDSSVCYLVLTENEGDLTKSIDHLLEISGGGNDDHLISSSVITNT